MDDDAGVGIGLQTMNVVSEWFTQCVSTRMLLARDIAVLIKIYTLLTDHVCGFWCQRVYVDIVFVSLLYKHATASSVNCLLSTVFDIIFPFLLTMLQADMSPTIDGIYRRALNTFTDYYARYWINTIPASDA